MKDLEFLKKEFTKIYYQYIEKIYRFIFLKVNCEETAKDLTSETFLKTWEKFREKKGNPIKNIQAFLYKTAQNLVINYYRKKMNFVPIEELPLSDPKTNLEEKANKDSDLERIKRALKNLSQEYQNVIVWYYLDGFSIKEISQMIGKSEGAVRVLIHRAIQKLKKELA